MVSRQQEDQQRREWMRKNPEAYRDQVRRTRPVGMGFRADQVTWLAYCDVGDCEFCGEAKGDEDEAVARLRAHHEAAHVGVEWTPPTNLTWEADDDDRDF